jgi:hypothetical protein
MRKASTDSIVMPLHAGSQPMLDWQSVCRHMATPKQTNRTEEEKL